MKLSNDFHLHNQLCKQSCDRICAGSSEISRFLVLAGFIFHSITAFYIKIGIIECKYTDGTPITNHIGWICTENQHLLGMRKGLDDEFLTLLLLHSLPKTKTWAQFISNTVEATSDTVPLTVAHVKSHLLCTELLLQDDPIHGQSTLTMAACQTLDKQSLLHLSVPTARKDCIRQKTVEARGGQSLESLSTNP
jgi:hypothetical protein